MKNSLPTLSKMAYPNKIVKNWGFKIRNIIKLPHPKLSKNYYYYYYYYYLKNGTQYWLLGKVIAYVCVRVYICVYIYVYVCVYVYDYEVFNKYFIKI